MCMRLNRDHVGINWEGEVVCHDVALSSGYVDTLASESDDECLACWYLISKEESNLDLDVLRLARGHHVQLQHDIAVRLKLPRHAVWLHRRHLSRRPCEKLPTRKYRVTPAATVVAGPRFFVVEHA